MERWDVDVARDNAETDPEPRSTTLTPDPTFTSPQNNPQTVFKVVREKRYTHTHNLVYRNKKEL